MINSVLKSPALYIGLLLCLFNLRVSAQTTADKSRISEAMETSLKNELLKPWYPASVDTVYGGFLSAFTFDFHRAKNQDKMIVTQARHTWTNAKASLRYPNEKQYRLNARHGYLFLRDKMWDKQYGGFHTYMSREGVVKPGNFAPKEAYGNAFALYALAAYYETSKDTTVLNFAKKQFAWLEKHSHDPLNKGYYQHMMMDGTPVKRSASEKSTTEKGYKDQNTSIHMLEALSELYQVWPDALVKERLAEMLFLIRDTIVNPKGYLGLFFTPDWKHISYRDSSEKVILQHKNLDHVSFGHDVETAYLMLEASHLLGLKNDIKTERMAKLMVDHALKNGWDNNKGGFYDEGYYFKDKPGITIIADTKNWWAQAEGLNSLLMMADKYPNDKMHYYRHFEKLWNYTNTYLIDHKNGDWYVGGIEKQPEMKTALKGQIWKGTYHNYRALVNCIRQLKTGSLF